MFVKRGFGARLIVERYWLIQDGPVAGFFEISRHAQHQPQRIVVEVAADGIIAALGQRLVLVIGAAVFELRGGNIQNALAGALRDHVDKAQQILIRIAETHPAPDARFVARCRTRHIERDHALVGVPDVDHPIGVFIRRLHLKNGQQLIPVAAQRFKSRIDLQRHPDSGQSSA